MLRVLCLCFVLLSFNTLFAEAYQVVTRNPVRNYNYNDYYNRYRIPLDELNALEQYSMNKNFTRETPIQRLERLESLAFGAIQYGDLESRYKNVENAILSRPKYNTKRTTLGNIANYFSGQMTGFTPSINQNYYPAQGYNTQRYDQFSNGIFGGGYRLMNSGFGNGSSVRILE